MNIIEFEEGKVYTTLDTHIPGFIVDGKYSETGEEAVYFDRILSFVKKKKGNVYHVINYGEETPSYIVTDGTCFAHGDTIKAARESLLYKIGDRDSSAFKNWDLDELRSKEELIKAYRVITGACESETRKFCETNSIPDKLSVRDAMKITQGRFNYQKFEEFFKVV